MSTATLSRPLSSVNVSPIVSRSEMIDLYVAKYGNGEITAEEMKAKMAELTTPARQSGPLFCKIGEKGAVSVYGLNSPRFPVTMYAAQWERLADFIPSVLDFIKQWDGKEYTGQAGKNGSKHQYRVTLARR